MGSDVRACRIVICDDQAPFRQVMSVVLGLQTEFDVVGEAVDGREAIDVVGKLSPDVLLLDVAMPRMDGLEALPHIRRVSPDTHVVMMTALASPGIRQRALDGGAQLFIEKGTDIDVIVEEIKRVCGCAS
jgi:DNA-binding NarL/FixJ family response regulator